MTLRRPAAHLRRTPGWRRSGDESYWESLLSEGEFLPPVSRPPRAPRPQSAIEGGQLDGWLEHLQRMQSDLLRVPSQDHVFSDRTASMPALNREQPGRAWRQQGIPSFSRGSSSCGSPSLCESSLGSQDSLQSGYFSVPERRESRERAHIMQAPQKEQAQLSYLAPVKIGWLPIQRRVMMEADSRNRNQFLDHSAAQVKVKQPITPVFQKNRVTPKAQDYPGKAARRNQSNPSTAATNFDRKYAVVEGSHTSSSALGVKTWQTADHGSPVIKQVPEKRSVPVNEGDRPVAWQALRRGWNTFRESALPGCSQSIELPTGNKSDPNRKSPLMKTTSVEPLKHTPLHQTTSPEPCGPHAQLQGRNSTETYRAHTALHRTSSAQPLRARAPLFRTNSSLQPSHIQTSSAVTTLIPQHKAGFSSITISSRKVSRSASLPVSDTYSQSCQSGESHSPPSSHQPMDPNSRHVTVQRKATIVKVTEQRVMSSPVLSTKRAGTPPANHDLDTVVHRRKATIIKVTEHRESYSPTAVRSGTRCPEYRNSYTEGLYKDNNAWSHNKHSQHAAAPSYHNLESAKRPDPVVAPNRLQTQRENGGTLHRSTLSLFVSSPPAIAAPAPSEVSPKAVGRRSDRPHRPLSCYGNVFGHTEPSKENVIQPDARKWSFGLPHETGINPVKSDSSFTSPGTAVKEAGQPVAETLKLNKEEKERLPLPEDAPRRASPCLTLIKAPDPHLHQSPEEVLALNAAAIIANIKLQTQLSKKDTPNGNSEMDSTASLQGNTAESDMSLKTRPDQSPVQRVSLPHAAFVPLSLDPERSPQTVSLQEALQKSRPDFINRSQGRVQELERRAQERRELAASVDSKSGAASRQRRAHRARSTSQNDNLFKPRDRVIPGKEMHIRSKRTLAEAKRKRDEEKHRETFLSNRQRVELFKKKLLDQILQRTSSSTGNR